MSIRPRPKYKPEFHPLRDPEDPDGVAALASVRTDEIRTLDAVRDERFPRFLRRYKGRRRAS